MTAALQQDRNDQLVLHCDTKNKALVFPQDQHLILIQVLAEDGPKKHSTHGHLILPKILKQFRKVGQLNTLSLTE